MLLPLQPGDPRGECCSPSNPGTPQNCLRRFCGEPHSGFPPPLVKSSVLLKCGICFSSFLIKFESRIEIIERRTVLTEHRCFAPPKILSAGTPMGRGRRLDAHGARVYLMFRLACEVANLYPTENSFGGDPELPRLASGGFAAVSLRGHCPRLPRRETYHYEGIALVSRVVKMSE